MSSFLKLGAPQTPERGETHNSPIVILVKVQTANSLGKVKAH